MKKRIIATLTILISLTVLTACASHVINAAQAARITDVPINPTEFATALPTVLPTEIVAPTAVPTATATVDSCALNRVQAEPEYQGDLLYKFQTSEHFVVLTIDDGYYDDVMNQMLDLMEAHNATATFFMLGLPVTDNISDATMKRLVEDGNDIAYHAYIHPSVEGAETMTKADWEEDYQKWESALRAKLGDELFNKAVAPYARVPYGPWTYDYMSFARENQLTPVFWTADNHAFEPKRTPLRDGGIIILHSIPEDIPVLKTMLEQDWKVVSLRQAMGDFCH